MIIDAIINGLGAVLSFVIGLFPSTTWTAPSAVDFLSLLTQWAGPVDNFAPLSDMFAFAELVTVIWLPPVLVYSMTMWVYRHIPIVGNG